MFPKCLLLILILKKVIAQNVDPKDLDLQRDLQNFEERKFSDLSENLFKFVKSLDLTFESEELETDAQPTSRKKQSKTMHSHMAPLIFKMGAASTWMLMTAVLAAKSVAIGLMLLVLKIVLNSAKLASLFSLLKRKHSHKQEPQWSWTPPPHLAYADHGHDASPYQHSDHDRTSSSLLDGPRIDTSGWHGYQGYASAPEWTPQDEEL